MAADEFSADYWIALVGRSTTTQEVSDVLSRHTVSLDRLKWTHGIARAALRDAGVYVYLWKPGIGRNAEVFAHGVEFVLSGMRGGCPYRGSMPHGIATMDCIDTIRTKLAPNTLRNSRWPECFEAELPDHRLLVKFSATKLLASCMWISTKELRRIPATNACSTNS